MNCKCSGAKLETRSGGIPIHEKLGCFLLSTDNQQGKYQAVKDKISGIIHFVALDDATVLIDIDNPIYSELKAEYELLKDLPVDSQVGNSFVLDCADSIGACGQKIFNAEKLFSEKDLFLRVKAIDTYVTDNTGDPTPIPNHSLGVTDWESANGENFHYGVQGFLPTFNDQVGNWIDISGNGHHLMGTNVDGSSSDKTISYVRDSVDGDYVSFPEGPLDTSRMMIHVLNNPIVADAAQLATGDYDWDMYIVTKITASTVNPFDSFFASQSRVYGFGSSTQNGGFQLSTTGSAGAAGINNIGYLYRAGRTRFIAGVPWREMQDWGVLRVRHQSGRITFFWNGDQKGAGNIVGGMNLQVLSLLMNRNGGGGIQADFKEMKFFGIGGNLPSEIDASVFNEYYECTYNLNF